MPGQKLWSATVALALRSVRYSRNPKRGRTGASHSSRGLPSANVSLFASQKAVVLNVLYLLFRSFFPQARFLLIFPCSLLAAELA